MSKIYSCFQGLITDDVVVRLNNLGLKTIYVTSSDFASDFFPHNYIDLVGKLYFNKTYDVILIDAIDVVIDGLVCVNIPTKIVVPNIDSTFPQYHSLVTELESYHEHVGNPELISEDDTLIVQDETLDSLIYTNFTFTILNPDLY